MEMYIDEEILRKDSGKTKKKKSKFQKRSAMQAILEWCKEKGCKYQDYQIMESLGYVRVLKDPGGDHYVNMCNVCMIKEYLSES